MPRIANEASALLADLVTRLERVVQTAIAEGHAQALQEIRSLVGGAAGAKRGPGRPRGSKNKLHADPAKPRKRRKNPWASMTAEQKAERVRKMLARRGLKPKGE